MSEAIKHECGIALIRLRKPISYYIEKYGTASWALQKLYLLMEKQHNRGQDGAGVASIKLDLAPGQDYIDLQKSLGSGAIKEIFSEIFKGFHALAKDNPAALRDPDYLKTKMPFAGELMMGHLRYGTFGGNKIENCHPVKRHNNWKTRTLLLAGNFNMTNNDELFENLIELGQHPTYTADTITVLEKIGHFLDDEVQKIFDKYNALDYPNHEITKFIIQDLDIGNILKRASKGFDGGFALCGVMGHGDAFVMRDAHGIRPAYYYYDEEIVVAASERPCIQTTFNVPFDKIHELDPGHALILKTDGRIKYERILAEKERKACSFERIYFSRGTDKEIYRERLKLGYLLTPKILKAVNYDLENTVFSFIPNTAEVAFYGLVKGAEEYLNEYKQKELESNPVKYQNPEALKQLLGLAARVEKIAVKDVKLRTFITDDSARDSMVSHVYDITYGSVKPHTDTLIMIDDSIVRGTTLQKSILSILDRLNPKKIVIVSSAPQIRYPDCYGIDMSKMSEFIAFRALIALIDERKWNDKLHAVYLDCKKELLRPMEEMQNKVQQLYQLFTDEEIEQKISEIVRPQNIFADVEILFQSVANLHQACPYNPGDWYFTGNYPTPGGIRVANRAFVNYIEGKSGRSY